jgi:hypothetical protein
VPLEVLGPPPARRPASRRPPPPKPKRVLMRPPWPLETPPGPPGLERSPLPGPPAAGTELPELLPVSGAEDRASTRRPPGGEGHEDAPPVRLPRTPGHEAEGGQAVHQARPRCGGGRTAARPGRRR